MIQELFGQTLRPRRAVWALALSRPSVLPSVTGTTSAPRMRVLSRLNGWPMRSLSTLRRCPREHLRMTRGRCGSLLLHRDGLAPSTPCRSPGALRSTPINGHAQRPSACLKSARKRHCLSLIRQTRPAAAAVLRVNALPIQKIDLVERAARLIEEQHEPQAISQIVLAGEIYPWIGHGRRAYASDKAKV